MTNNCTLGIINTIIDGGLKSKSRGQEFNQLKITIVRKILQQYFKFKAMDEGGLEFNSSDHYQAKRRIA